MLKKLDIYIIRKFLGTFFLSIILIISVAVVFDITEKIDDFMENQAPIKAIIFDYYLNFIPYYANLFSPLFTFIAVIFFTSKLADNSEIIATFASGISFHRFVRPYMISASIIALLTFFLSSYIIPPANKERIDFQEVYVKKKKKDQAIKIRLWVTENEVFSIDYYDKKSQSGRRASIDKFDGKTLKQRIISQEVEWHGENNWRLINYTQRDFDGLYEHLSKGDVMDIQLNVIPEDFFVFAYMQEQMTTPELTEYIQRQKSRGVGNIKDFEIEYAKRYAFPFAAFILTIIGVSLSSKKIKGGMGINLGIGLGLSFGYILFYSISSTFAINGSLSPTLAVWLPNITFGLIAIALYKKAPK
ncbi:MAG: LptF/LptG family permease [Paludibacteraceae bacterium]|nr:LptF/LptG family permease [Paludibacteraceae bacterium]